MEKFILVFMLMTGLFASPLQAQNFLIQDVDADGLKDTIQLDTVRRQLEAKLSLQHFNPINSAAGLELTNSTYLQAEDNGFSYNVSYMRGGFSARFIYDVPSGTILLKELNQWNASSGTSGAYEAELDVETGLFTMRSEYWDAEAETWNSAEPLQKQVYYPGITLSDFSEDLLEYFTNQNALLRGDFSDEIMEGESMEIIPNKGYTWLGSLGEDIPVFLQFQVSGESFGNKGHLVVGSLRYLKNRQGTSIPLIGTYSQSGNLRLNEYSAEGEVTGIITGHLQGFLFKGDWDQPYQDKNFSMKLYYLGLHRPAESMDTLPGDIFGAYHYNYSEQGPQGDVVLEKINEKQAELSMFGVTSAPSRNMADGADKTRIDLPQSTHFTYNISYDEEACPTCKVELYFFKHFLYVIYPEEENVCKGFFGHNATLEGIYYKVR